MPVMSLARGGRRRHRLPQALVGVSRNTEEATARVKNDRSASAVRMYLTDVEIQP